MEAALPNENVQLYVIGDIHGRLDLLDGVIGAINRDVEEHGSVALTVTLGDYIDRGPSSRGVLERLIGNPFPTPPVVLKGNPAVGKHWRSLGVAETLHSYGACWNSENDYNGGSRSIAR